jgi:hypothetical protein
MWMIGDDCVLTWTNAGKAAASSDASAVTPPTSSTSLKSAVSTQVCQPSFFLTKVLLVGLGGDAVDDASDLELGFTEEGSVGRGDQSTSHLKQFALGHLSEGGSEFLSLGFLFGREGLLHRSFSDTGGGFLGKRPCPSLVYKDSTNLRDAHTCAVRLWVASGQANRRRLHCQLATCADASATETRCLACGHPLAAHTF